MIKKTPRKQKSRKNINTQKEYKVVYEYVSAEDEEERITRIYEFIVNTARKGENRQPWAL
jgi:hypothetical protein